MITALHKSQNGRGLEMPFIVTSCLYIIKSFDICGISYHTGETWLASLVLVEPTIADLGK